MGLEIMEQVPDVDAVVVPVGGAGLIAGISLAIKSLNPSIQIIVSCEALSSIWNYPGLSIDIYAVITPSWIHKAIQ